MRAAPGFSPIEQAQHLVAEYRAAEVEFAAAVREEETLILEEPMVRHAAEPGPNVFAPNGVPPESDLTYRQHRTAMISARSKVLRAGAAVQAAKFNVQIQLAVILNSEML